MAKTKADEPATAAENLKTSQEKAGKDPVSPAKEPGEKVKPVEVGTREPYPDGSPQDPEDQFFAAHGYRRAKE